jgi:hypothetical protein
MTTIDDGSPDPGLGQTQQWRRVKPINDIYIYIYNIVGVCIMSSSLKPLREFTTNCCLEIILLTKSDIKHGCERQWFV